MLWQVNHHVQQASSSSQSPRSPEESSGQLHHMRGHLREDHHHRHSPGEPQFTSRRLPHSRSHRDMNGRRHNNHGRGDSPTSRLPKSTPGCAQVHPPYAVITLLLPADVQSLPDIRVELSSQ